MYIVSVGILSVLLAFSGLGFLHIVANLKSWLANSLCRHVVRIKVSSHIRTLICLSEK